MKYALIAVLAISGVASASPITYAIDPGHTHPEFEVDHLGGVSVVTVDVASVEFGNDKLNDEAVNSSAPPIFEAQKYPTAHYRGTLGGFVSGSPTTVAGFLTLHGVTKPVALRISSFKCAIDLPATQKQVCGADAVGTFNRADFGITIGQRFGFNMGVTLHIQVKAFRVN
jgi:polyisoprenoid-binding protein YceI